MGIIQSLWHYSPLSFLPLNEPACLSQRRLDPVALARDLRGKEIKFDMTKSFTHWTKGATHEELERIRDETDRVLERTFACPLRRQRLQKCDFGLFSALWWSDADWEDLYTAMLFTVCLFAWDDTIDTNEGALALDFEQASLWRQKTLAYFKYQLNLAPEEYEPSCPDEVCLIFKEFGERFFANVNAEQRLRMYCKIEDFVKHSDLEQAERLSGRIPNYEEYMRIRPGVTGVRMFSLLLK